jgi:ribA/ribD-fused uncharacterized protein
MNKYELLEVVEYQLNESCAFKKVKEEFGGFSNMSNDFKVRVNGILMKNTEALYQACRFPDSVEIQREIVKQGSGMSAKMKSRHFRPQTRADWDDVRVDIMRWCVRVKLAQNFIGFGKLLESTGDKPIVEYSHKDTFWGAILTQEGVLKGQNVLGKLLMEIRDEYRLGTEESEKLLRYVEPPVIDNFRLLGDLISPVGRRPLPMVA